MFCAVPLVKGLLQKVGLTRVFEVPLIMIKVERYEWEPYINICFNPKIIEYLVMLVCFLILWKQS